MTNVAVVILNWNGQKFLEKFLPGIIEHTGSDAEVIVADNASTDNSVAFLNATYPSLRVIINKENLGFAEGYNQALKQIKADYYVLLNSDLEVSENWIKPVVTLMESDPSIAACQPKILSFYDRAKFEYAGAAGGFIDYFGYPFCRGRIFDTLETDHGQYNDTIEIFWATGACMFVKAELYHKIGGLDGAFFAHMEEIDFCWRLKNLGYKIMYCPHAFVYHIGGGTLPKNNARKTYFNYRNNFTLLFKNLPYHKFLLIFIVRLFLDGIAALKFLYDGGFKNFFSVTRAHFAFYRRIPGLIKQKRKLMISPVNGCYKRSIVFSYYLRKHKIFTQLNKEKFSANRGIEVK